jgi:hypothetical protein
MPVDGFWSITVYDAEGYLEPNQYNVYSVSRITAKKGADGLVISSAAATAKFLIAFRSRRAGTTRFVSFARDPNPRWQMENSRRRSPLS